MKRVWIALLGVLFLLGITYAQNTVEVLAVRTDAKFTQSDVNDLYYIQCIDLCNEWYALDDIADLYVGFERLCDAVNYWKLLMWQNYGDAYAPFPCSPDEGGS